MKASWALPGSETQVRTEWKLKVIILWGGAKMGSVSHISACSKLHELWMEARPRGHSAFLSNHIPCPPWRSTCLAGPEGMAMLRNVLVVKCLRRTRSSKTENLLGICTCTYTCTHMNTRKTDFRTKLCMERWTTLQGTLWCSLRWSLKKIFLVKSISYADMGIFSRTNLGISELILRQLDMEEKRKKHSAKESDYN